MHDSFISDSRPIFCVSEVTQDIKKFLEDSFSQIWIVGEVSNFKASVAGHLYFTLKDAKAQMKVVMFRGAALKLKFEIEDGMELVLHGNMTVYEARGDYQLLADHAEPKGVGALQLAFEQLKKKLSEEGLFDSSRKRPIPYLPRKIGLITSSQGAVLHDMQTVIRRRYPLMDIVILPVKVQGDGSADEIVSAISFLNQRDDVDVLLVGRGGGSLEDLWSFNEEKVVRAIAASRIPIISAVGHETDTTLADFVADLRAPTPSAAAELAVPVYADLVDSVVKKSRDLQRLVTGLLDSWVEQVTWYQKRFSDPRAYLAEMLLRVDDETTRLVQAAQRSLKNQEYVLNSYRQKITSPHQIVSAYGARLEFASAKIVSLIRNTLLVTKNKVVSIEARWPDMRQRLERQLLLLASTKEKIISYSPLENLKKGYALLLRKNSNEILRSIQDVKIGDELKLKLSDGDLLVKIL